MEICFTWHAIRIIKDFSWSSCRRIFNLEAKIFKWTRQRWKWFQQSFFGSQIKRKLHIRWFIYNSMITKAFSYMFILFRCFPVSCQYLQEHFVCTAIYELRSLSVCRQNAPWESLCWFLVIKIQLFLKRKIRFMITEFVSRSRAERALWK